MAVKEGYKQTEVGIIPEDWEVISLGKVSDIKTGPFGSTLHAEDYVIAGTPIITVEHLGESSITYKNLPMVSDYDKKRLYSYTLKVNDIVFSRVGSVDRNARVTNSEDGWLFSGRLLRIRPEKIIIDSRYLSYHFHFEPVRQLIRNVAVGQTMASLNTKLLSMVEIVIPPLTEQKAIATVLSDIDGLINSLTKLIEKKKSIKQGAMQELLTGKKRLDGFSGEWVIKTVEEISAIYKGYGLSKGNLSNIGKNKCILYGELFTTYNQVIKKVRNSTNSIEGKLSEVGDVLLPGSTTTSGIDLSTASALYQKGVLLGGDIIILRNKKDIVDSTFLAYCLSEIYKKQIEEISQGITIIHLHGSRLGKINIKLPQTLEEQTAIATILSDMDTEIETLQTKLDKYKVIKQGMMQELLTGKIRLLEGA